MLVKGLRFIAILLVALLGGLAFAHVLERPAKMKYEGALYLTLQKTLYVEWGPPNVGGILEPAAILATLVLAFAVRRRRSAFWLTLGASVALLLAFPVVFFWFVAPSNEIFLAAPAATVPSNWMTLRSNWETGHTIRFVLQLIALSLLVLSVLIEHPSNHLDEGRGA
jgi:NO-binding membrane sensor protein with MHYT domain